MPKKYFKKFLPSHETVKQSRWIRPFGAWLQHPNLWHLHRRSVAGGVAIGMFCGLIPGPLQMIGAALLAVLFRVNLPVAMFTTLYTNPLTIAPLYVLAYELGALVTGQHNGLSDAHLAMPEMDWSNWFTVMLEWVVSLGKPFAVGLPLLAVILAIMGYFIVRVLWYAMVVWEWRKRASRRAKNHETACTGNPVMQINTAKLPSLLFGHSIFIRCALFLLIGASLLRKLFDPDIWFHMIVGREVVRQMHIPGYEFYILPRLGEPGEFHEWGFGVLYYLVEHYSGYTGMAIANAAVGCGILLCLYSAHSKTGTEWWQSLPIMMLALWVIEPRLNFRPETLLYLLLAVEIYLLGNYLAQKKLAWLFPLPVLSWLLSLCHPSAIFLIGVFGMYSIHAVFASAEKVKTAGTLGVIGFAMTVSSTLNPYGVHQLLMPFYALANDELIKSVNEFLPVLQTVYAPYFISIAIVGSIAILFSPQRRMVDILLFFVFAILAFRYARNIALLGIITYAPIYNTFSKWVARLAKTGVQKIFVALFSICIGFAGIAKIWDSSVWGVGIDEEFTPYKNAQLLKRVATQGNILNFYHLGSYLAWELERPVFVDGKNYGTNKAVALHDDIFMARQGWQNVVDAYNIQAIVTPVTLTFSGEIIPLVALLENDRDWVVVGQEKSGLLFVRNRGQEGISPLPKEVIWQQAIEELNNTIQSYPDSREAYRSLSVAYGHIGDATKQRYFYEKYLSLPK